jgi:hypothetical protein
MQKDSDKFQSCSEFEPLLILHAAGEELDRAEQSKLARHLAHCADCAAALEEEEKLLALLSEHHSEPDATLLASCRVSLLDTLDHLEERGWLRRSLGTLLPSGLLSPRPAWSAALLLIIGFSVGILGPRVLRHPQSPASSSLDAAATDAGKNVPTAPSLSTIDLHSADVAGINVFPAGADARPQVELQLRAQQPVTLQGTVDNDDVERVLLNVLRDNKRFDADVRLNAVELLRARNDDPEVRSVLCHAVHTDRNAAVRLKALEALDGAEPQGLVRQTLLDALVDDQNPGVRVEAINALRQMAAEGKVTADDRMLAVLRERVKNDPNTYIRLQSAAVIRDLGPREKF